MTLSLAPTQSDALGALRDFLVAILPPGVDIVQGQDNRVPEPEAADFVIFTPTRRERIETNVDTFVDCTFTGVIDTLALTVSDIVGKIILGQKVFGAALPVAGITIVAQVSGPAGGNGVYAVPAGTDDAAEAPMAAGVGHYMQPTKLTVQIDVHGPSSADNAQTISTMFRDDFAVQFFADMGPDPVPLYADDPKQMPFSNDQQQIENRWVIEALLQTNQVVTAPQQFAQSIAVGVINVEATYPPQGA